MIICAPSMSVLRTWFSTYRTPVLLGAAALILLGGVFFGSKTAEGISVRVSAAECASRSEQESVRVDCWIELALNYVQRGDISAAYRTFGYLYGAYPSFGASGCHVHAHKLGDAAYYNFFISQGLKLSEMNFPQETTSCGYGFFHGFIEHLIQDYPQTAYVKETCEYLREALSTNMHDIARICYHASGHGFLQAEADSLTKERFGNVPVIVARPLKRCEALPGVTEMEIEECREGVFNVVSDWMIEKNFGLSFDFKHPFVICDALPERWHWACYYEFGQKLASVIGDKPLVAEQYVASIRKKDIREMTLGVIIAGMMQRLAPLNQYVAVYEDCARMKDDGLSSVCIRSATNGMMEHGEPGKEYEKIIPMCSLPSLREREGAEICHDTLARRLSRFYPPAKKTDICNMFPPEYRTDCIKTP